MNDVRELRAAAPANPDLPPVLGPDTQQTATETAHSRSGAARSGLRPCSFWPQRSDTAPGAMPCRMMLSRPWRSGSVTSSPPCVPRRCGRPPPISS